MKNQPLLRSTSGRSALTIPLLLLFTLLVVSSRRECSLTYDESLHLTSGYSLALHRDNRLDRIAPPLPRLLAGLSLRSLPLSWPGDGQAWARGDLVSIADRFLYKQADVPVERIRERGRWPSLILGLLMGWGLHRWCRRHHGRAVATAALLLMALEPNLIAHAGLATHDLTAASMAFLAFLLFEEARRRDRPIDFLLAGAALGAALASKATTAVLIPAQLLVWFGDPRHRPTSIRAVVTRAIPFIAAALLLCHAAGLGLVVHLDELREYPERRGGLAELIGRAPLPGPVATHLFYGHLKLTEQWPCYLWGHHSRTGWRWYYLAALVHKLPLTMLLLLLAFPLVAWRNRRDGAPGWTEVSLLLPPILLLAAASRSSFDIGLRQILPVFPFLLVLAARSLEGIRGRGRTGPALAAGLILLLGLECAGTHPHYLSHFNPLWGGARQGHRYLADSNLTWGQDLGRLARVLRTDPSLRQAWISPAFHRQAALACHGIPDRPVPHLLEHVPTDGTYVVHTFHLQNVAAPERGRFTWLKLLEPDRRIGVEYWLYDVRLGSESPEAFLQRHWEAAESSGFQFPDLRRFLDAPERLCWISLPLPSRLLDSRRPDRSWSSPPGPPIRRVILTGALDRCQHLPAGSAVADLVVETEAGVESRTLNLGWDLDPFDRPGGARIHWDRWSPLTNSRVHVYRTELPLDPPAHPGEIQVRLRPEALQSTAGHLRLGLDALYLDFSSPPAGTVRTHSTTARLTPEGREGEGSSRISEISPPTGQPAR